MRSALLLIGTSLLTLACATKPVAAPMSFPSSVAAVTLATSSGVLHGTLRLPERSSERIPVTLLVAGSGPTDRDGNSAALPGKNNSLQLLAGALAKQGIASVAYDKRGVGESAAAASGSESELRFDHYVDDAAAWIRQLRNDSRFSTVTVIGHSEGSLIAMRAAREAVADAVVSIAGSSRRASMLIREQLRPQLPAELWNESERILARLERGETADNVPPALNVLYRPSVQPYLISWFGADPSRDVAALAVPVLVVQGTTDIQVPLDDAHALHVAAARSEIVIIERMNHVLKMVDSDRGKQIASYSDPSLPLAPGLGERIAAFVKGVSRRE